MQRLGHSAWVTCCDAQEGQSGPIRRSPSLLPIAQRCDADADHQSELGLRGFELFSDTLDVCWPKRGHSTRPQFSPANPSRLANAAEQFLKATSFM